MYERDTGLKLKSTPPEDIALTISGGGHRAALYGLGVLLAFVHRGLNRKVKRISSVSGGSIVNAYIALNTKFNDPNLTPHAFNEIAAKLIKIIVHKGVLTYPIIISLFLGLIIPPILFLLLAFKGQMSWFVSTGLVCVWLIIALKRGYVIEWLIEYRYFTPSIKFEYFPPKIILKRKYLKDFQINDLEHAICATDLIKPCPVYFSSLRISKNHDPGSLSSCTDNKSQHITRDASKIPVASAVYSSAAFPGAFPPRMIRFESKKEDVVGYKNVFGDSLFDITPFLKEKYVLADGGVWNNLGTHVIRELDWEKMDFNEMVLLSADASVPMSRQHWYPYKVPFWSLIRSLIRIGNIQLHNTIEPRLKNLQENQMNQLFGSSRTISEDIRLASQMEVLKLNKKQREEFLSLNNYGYLMPTIPWDITLRLDSTPDFPINVISEIRNNMGSTHLDQYGAVEDAYYSARELQSLSNIDVASLKTDLNRININHAKCLIAKGH
jgi:predicted acylesterase/phospholipase RssA